MAQAASKKPSEDKSPERAVWPAREPDHQSGMSGAQAQMLALQRTIGNRAIGQLLGSARVSPLSTTGNVIPQSLVPQKAPANPKVGSVRLQRKCACGNPTVAGGRVRGVCEKQEWLTTEAHHWGK